MPSGKSDDDDAWLKIRTTTKPGGKKTSENEAWRRKTSENEAKRQKTSDRVVKRKQGM